MNHRISFLIGASGAGKTAVAQRLEAAGLASLQVCYFDRGGVPDASDMIREYGSGEAWQRVRTREWVETIRDQHLATNDVLLDAQTRPSFIEEACSVAKVGAFDIILLDCADDVRRARLAERCQAYLAIEEMMDWARYLRNECRRRNLPIIDTTNETIHDVVMSVVQLMGSGGQPWSSWSHR
jgi:adenylate kinase family enzyme